MFSYSDFLSPAMRDFLLKDAQAVPGVPGLRHIGTLGGLENQESLAFLLELYRQVAPELQRVLEQRVADRDFVDQRTRALYRYNCEQGLDVTDEGYKTVLDLEDSTGRVVVGPLKKNYWTCAGEAKVAPLPPYLQGVHVTLFGPPDSAKMCINAMNAYHRQLKGEPAIVRELLATHDSVPKWGADDEDSKTPLREDLVAAGENLSQCFSHEISLQEAGGKSYRLEKDKLSLPIKRFPGLALPCSFLFYEDKPIPLHLYDVALHLFKNWQRPEALVFYVPKLENEEEARYVKNMLAAAEELLRRRHPGYTIGTIRLMIVLENPRAVFRTHEIIDELYPYFAGASLGWHDFLASAARLFKEDGNYRIPTKADPDIVIKYIKASHELLANVVGPRGGIKIGGMYGILPLNNDLKSESFQMTIKGYFRDVITQFKRNLDGFWVAHPDFVRLGLAMVEGWRFYQKGDKGPLTRLVTELLEPQHSKEVLDFIFGPDIPSLDPENPRYARALIVADLKESQKMANSAPEELRYNIFQSLQYLTDWLSGNGCVALPAQVGGVSVRVMDDLATAERSRWEVWHELRHGRVQLHDFLRMAHEELHFIRKDLSNDKKIVQVKWDERTAKWYPIAFKLMLKLMCDPEPVEFATALLLPFTMPAIRNSANPWAVLEGIDAQKYALPRAIRAFNHYFEICGHQAWATQMSRSLVPDLQQAEASMRAFSLADINAAAAFHGDIGEARKGLDATAAAEQAAVLKEEQSVRDELLRLGDEYKKKFGMKFLVSAKGKGASELLASLKQRLNNSAAQELAHAQSALWEISLKRLQGQTQPNLRERLETLRKRYKVKGLQFAFSLDGEFTETLCVGEGADGKAVQPQTYFEMASISKPIAAAFALDFFGKRGFSLDTKVNEILAKTSSSYRLRSAPGLPGEWADRVTLAHLFSHSALNMHYVEGVPCGESLPPLPLEQVQVIAEPGQRFQYSGGGFLLLEHVVQALSGQNAHEATALFLRELNCGYLTFQQASLAGKDYAHGYTDKGEEIAGTRLMFPAFAAGAMGTAAATLKFFQKLGKAWQDPHTRAPLSHDVAAQMLHATDKGSLDFMGARMGLGVFVAEAGDNKIALHQGANDGFRALALHCVEGPNAGQGLVAFANGELSAVHLIAEATQLFLQEAQFAGVNLARLKADFDPKAFKPEEVVNRGYKDRIFSAFEPCLPDPVPRRAELDPLSAYNTLLGAKILRCSNQRFARAENLIDPHVPCFEVDLYCAQGKVMDSWESARHNPQPFDELVLQLREPRPAHMLLFSTAYHAGNHAPFVSVDGLEAGKETAGEWVPLVPKIALEGHSLARVRVDKSQQARRWSQLRVRMYPDGGLSRVHVFDSTLPAAEAAKFSDVSDFKCEPLPGEIPRPHKPLAIPVDSAATSGDRVLSCSNEHYGPAAQLLSPFEPLHMFDGFESARSRSEGHYEHCHIALGKARPLQRIEADFTYFVNNNPRALRFEALGEKGWEEIVPLTSVKAFAGNRKIFYLDGKTPYREIKVFVYPDGGINRLRFY